MRKTRRKLLENFDEAVHERLRVSDEKSKHNLGRFEQLLMQLTQTELDSFATFDDSGFDLHRDLGLEDVPLGRYELPRRSSEVHLYRLSHPLAQHVIAQAKTRPLEVAYLEFDYEAYPNKITVIENLRGQCGWLRLSRFTVSALTQTEDHLILAAHTDEGTPLEPGIARDLFKLPARSLSGIKPFSSESLEYATQAQQDVIQRSINERNARYFEEEAERLDAWAEDLKVGLERDLKDIDRQIKETRRAASSAVTLEEKLEGQKRIKTLEATRSQKRRALFDAQDDIDRQRGALIEELEGKLQQDAHLEEVFTIRWRVV